jgi:hypothetical protein
LEGVNRLLQVSLSLDVLLFVLLAALVALGLQVVLTGRFLRAASNAQRLEVFEFFGALLFLLLG